MKKIIGVSGKKGSGKDTFFEIVNESAAYIYDNKKFADKLKEICILISGMDKEFFYDRNKYSEYMKIWNMDCREMMQKIGTDVFRNNFDTDIWVKALESNINDNSNWIVTDVRFPNEVDMIKRHGGLIIRVNRPEIEDNDAHLSEIALDGFKNWDVVIENARSLQDYKRTIYHIVEKYKL